MLIFTTPDMDRFQHNTSLTMCITFKVKWYKFSEIAIQQQYVFASHPLDRVASLFEWLTTYLREKP
jgi:hypothetical protein